MGVASGLGEDRGIESRSVRRILPRLPRAQIQRRAGRPAQRAAAGGRRVGGRAGRRAARAPVHGHSDMHVNSDQWIEPQSAAPQIETLCTVARPNRVIVMNVMLEFRMTPEQRTRALELYRCGATMAQSQKNVLVTRVRGRIRAQQPMRANEKCALAFFLSTSRPVLKQPLLNTK
jgi:hypothetical protein